MMSVLFRIMTTSLAGVLALMLTTYSADSLVVHEWGTFTSVVDADGSIIEWEPYRSQRRDLPTFVYGSKVNAMGTVRMETPVIYFYSPKELACIVRVDFPQGQITEFYPMPDQWLYLPDAIQWSNVELLPRADEGLPVEKIASHYYHARDTDATTLRVRQRNKMEYEKFLFYRGVGTFALPLSAKLLQDRGIVVDAGDSSIREIVLFENRKGTLGCRFERLSGSETTFAPALPECSVELLKQNLQALLVNHRLYPREAEAMVKTWEGSWFEEGLRIFYILPRKRTDAVLPLTITPQPTEIVRVLVGRLEFVTAEAREDTVRFLTQLSQFGQLPEAGEEQRRHGRFLEPLIRSVLESDSTLRESVELQKALILLGLFPRTLLAQTR